MGRNRLTNLHLLAIVVLLAILNVGFAWWQPEKSGLKFDRSLFTIADTAKVASIQLQQEQGDLYMARQNDWLIADGIKADPEIRKLLFTLMQYISCARPISSAELDKLRANQSGVSVAFEGANIPSFIVYFNQTMSKTYFVTNDKGYEMIVPGYRDFVGAVFTLTPTQWHDRLIIDANWRSIQRLQLTYADEPDKPLDIQFDGRFFGVNGIASVDTTTLINYMNGFEAFRANEKVYAGQNVVIDSVVNLPEYATLIIDDFRYTAPKTLRIQPIIPGMSYRVVIDESANLFLIDNRRIRTWLKSPSDFKKQ